jgi:hypothetical protein
MPLSSAALAHGAQVAAALLGLDQLYRAESGDSDGLAVLNLDTANQLTAESFPSYRAARRRFDDLARAATGLPEPDRRVYYADLARSTAAFLTWREEGLPFRDQLTGFLGVPAEPVGDEELDSLRAAIRSPLERLGFTGDLATQCAAWEARHRVVPEEVPAVLTTLLDQAWDRTAARLLPVPAPKADGMRVAAVSGVAFNARCSYLDRRIEVNTDPILTTPGLKHLAVHEGLPGHYLQFKLRETWYRDGTAPADGLLSCVNTASSSVFEGIADAGLAMIGWIESDDDWVQLALNRYRVALGTGAAWRLHALDWPEARVSDWLRSQALTGGDGWVANRIAFIRAPARAVLIWSYWWGEPTVASAWSQVVPSRQREFLEFLHGRLHSVASVGMFA